MPLTVRSFSLKELSHLYRDKELDLAPDYQRREAWNAKKSMSLIDSIARRIPINAITLYKTNQPGGLVYEVIDGKQRLTALMQFQNDELVPLRESLKDLSEEEESEGKELAEQILDKKWSELTGKVRSEFLDYEVPIYVVVGSRASAVRAFRRMNADPYALNPQEIRNAVFKDSEFLKAACELSSAIDKLIEGSEHSLVGLGVITATQWLRMQDVQFVSELLCLALSGPQEARRTLDNFYENYFSPRGAMQKKLREAVATTRKSIEAIRRIMGDSLSAHHFDNENDFYSLVGALLKRGIPTGPQLADRYVLDDLRETLSLFRNQVLLCQQAMKDASESELRRYEGDVKAYATTLILGQINSAKRRQSRIDILCNVINDRVDTLDPKKVSELQRRLVWAKSADKKCGRCGEEVAWVEYDCGHIDAHAFGGRAVLPNLRVEHRKCNRVAQAK